LAAVRRRPETFLLEMVKIGRIDQHPVLEINHCHPESRRRGPFVIQHDGLSRSGEL
jgi:hypothetical protein